MATTSVPPAALQAVLGRGETDDGRRIDYANYENEWYVVQLSEYVA